MGGLVGPERVAQLYKTYRGQLPQTPLGLAALSIRFEERYVVKEEPIPQPGLSGTRAEWDDWFRRSYFQRWKNPRQKRAAKQALDAELARLNKR